MPADILSRAAESRTVNDFLDTAGSQTAGLHIEGEAGIGKTTVWSAAVGCALGRGFRVLSTRSAAAESVLAYAAVADMLDDVDPALWRGLPSPQAHALDRVTLRCRADDVATDPRAVAAGLLALLKRLEEETPILLAIDDLQWLDSSSMRVVAFAARRLVGRVGVLTTVRNEPNHHSLTGWLQLPPTAEVSRICLGPLTLGGMREVLSEKLRRRLSRATMVRIYDLSRGNPFYALELARMIDNESAKATERLPDSLADLVRARVGSLRAEVREVLLATACASAPTVELVAAATGQDTERIVELLDEAQDKAVVGIDGHRIHFVHPLLARGVLSAATTSERRRMHRLLADAVEGLELQARHLAMAVAWADPTTLDCLENAAHSAEMRGAPAAAAELLGMAIDLGGDTPERRIRLAGYHFAAGDTVEARELLDVTIKGLQPGGLRAEALRLLGPVRIFGDSFPEGVAAMERALVEAGDDLSLRVPTLVRLLVPLFNTGQLAAAADRADEAVRDAQRLGQPLLVGQALSLRVVFDFLIGRGFDEKTMQSALDIEDRHTEATNRSGFQMIVRPRSHHALLLGWIGQLERAREEMARLRRECIDHGLENDWIYVTYYSVQVALWRGDFAEAAALVEMGAERALQQGGEVSIGAAMTWRAALAAYNGDEEQVRRDVEAARAAMQRCGAHMLERWPIATLGFLEVSLGNYEAALSVLEPLLSEVAAAPEATEIYLAEFVPDAVEALVHLGCLDKAESLTEALERNGRRLDRAWMLAVGARCRSMLLAACGDADAAERAAHAAMAEHERLPMPFERARTQLLLGQLQRRRGHRNDAMSSIREAQAAFERMGALRWADRACTELARADVSTGQVSTLTESEKRVAVLAASGMTNRDVAAMLFISPKTVEANLARIYRKLGIHSRAELGRRMVELDGEVGART